MIQPAFEILNQRGTPMFFSDVFANRPAAGIIGRIFISTDTKEFYRDTGSTWELIGGTGSGTITGSGASGQVTFWTGASAVSGSNNLFFDNASGKLLVGTNNTAGASRLQVTSSTGDDHLRVWGTTSPSIRIDNAATGATQRFVMGLATATNNFIQGSAAGNVCISTASASPILFGMWQTINASEVMRISTANNLLIGFTIDNGNRLQVAGNGYFSGNVGIGVASSSYKLDVFDLTTDAVALFDSGNTNGSHLRLAASGNIKSFIGCAAGFISSGGVDDLGLRAVGAIRFATNGAGTDMLLDALGNLGLGTNLPGSYSGYTTLSINNPVNGGVLDFLSNGTRIASINNSSTTFDIETKTAVPMAFATSNSERMRITTAGNLLIGTTVDVGARLIVNGFSRFDRGTLTMVINPSYGGSNVFSQIQSSSNLQIATGGDNNRIYITSGGNVLINSTVDQGQRFYLNGSFRIDGQTSGTAGGSSGQHLIINCDGVTYKIALLNN